MIRRHILYVAYGADCYVHEAAFSILSLWRQADAADYAVTVVTDRAALLERLLGCADRTRVLALDAEQVRLWQGQLGYVHRAKPLAIQWATRQVAAPQDMLLYVDSDTVFTRNPAPLFDAVDAGRVVLNELEGGVASSRHQTRSHGKLYRASCAHLFQIRGRRRHLAPDTGLWNSGVLGFRPTMADVFDETVALIDDMYPVVSINTIEQVALSVVLQDRGVHLQDSGDVIFHYHYFKEFRQDLARFFERYAQADTAARLVRWPEIDPVERVHPKLAFHAQPKWRRQLLKWMGRNWRPLPYPWA